MPRLDPEALLAEQLELAAVGPTPLDFEPALHSPQVELLVRPLHQLVPPQAERLLLLVELLELVPPELIPALAIWGRSSPQARRLPDSSLQSEKPEVIRAVAHGTRLLLDLQATTIIKLELATAIQRCPGSSRPLRSFVPSAIPHSVLELSRGSQLATPLVHDRAWMAQCHFVSADYSDIQKSFPLALVQRPLAVDSVAVEWLADLLGLVAPVHPRRGSSGPGLLIMLPLAATAPERPASPY